MNVIKSYFKWKSTPQKRMGTNLIVLHHAEAKFCTVQDIHQWHLQNGWSGIGYHFFVAKNGMIYEGRPIDTIGAHCLNYNSYSIGICAEGDYETDTMPDLQKASLKELLQNLQKLYPDCEIKGHKELNDTKCPAENYPLEEIKVSYRQNYTPTLADDLRVLMDNDIIKSPAYWKEKAVDGLLVNGEYVRILIQNMAKKLRG